GPTAECLTNCWALPDDAFGSSRAGVVAQFDCHPEQAVFAQRGIWASRGKAPALSKRSAPKGRVLCDPNNRAFGSLPRQPAPLPVLRQTSVRLKLRTLSLGMQSNPTLARRLVHTSALPCFVVLCLLSRQAIAQTHAAAGRAPPSTAAVSPEHDPLVDAAFDHFYNMDYDRSIQEFEKVMDRRPNDPSAVNHLLTTILMRELYRMGGMNSGEYANDSFVGEAHRTADPKVKERIKQLVERAESLEDQQIKDQELKANADNVDALYARGVTRAQFALYTALVERAWFSSLRNAVGARHDHERVLELDPQYVDAKLVVGTHNYVMGSLPWSVKVAVALVGRSGSKEKGL